MPEKGPDIAKLAAYLMLLVLALAGGACTKPNSVPIITSLEAESNPVPLSGKTTITCTAHDEDGDPLVHSWSSSQGLLSGQGSTITWEAPSAPGSYTITVTAIDAHGGQTAGQISVDVVDTNKAPVIEVLKADPSLVNPGETSIIRCVASDPDGDDLTYLWAATKGDIVEEGASAIWTAPDSGGTHTITLTVTDGNGGEARRGVRVGQSSGSGGGGGGG